MYELYIYHIAQRTDKRIISNIEHYYADKFNIIYKYAQSRGMIYRRLNKVNDLFIEELNSDIFVRNTEPRTLWQIISGANKYNNIYEEGLFFNFYRDGALLEFERETGFPRGMTTLPRKKRNNRHHRKTVWGSSKSGGSFLHTVDRDKAQIEWEIQECEEYLPNVTKQWRVQYADYEIGYRKWDWPKRSRKGGSWKNQKKKRQWM